MIAGADAERLIKGREFRRLFIDLGWDAEVPAAPIPLEQGEFTFKVKRVAEKRGFTVCVCDAGNEYPARKVQRQRLVNMLSRYHYEHLLILCGGGKQCWTLAIRPQNRPMRTVEVEWHENQGLQPLLEKLSGIFFDISEEEALGLTDVVDRVRGAFMTNSERVTRRFYGLFKKELEKFSGFVTGITDAVSRDWYAALMLNRLMFIYFIQKKGFLDGNINYLEDRLRMTRERYGKDEFDRRFYRHFLRRLFSEGLGTPEEERGPELRELLGKVPYLNGGLFDVHEIERENGEIEIPDRAFENLFGFFGQYNWHLDTRATATGRDINPDVIGYIFEKYINDRAEMGAYYTQEDITGYISRNTIIPFLLNRAKEGCKKAFDPENGIWRFLRERPDDYIYDAVKRGCDIPDGEIPENIRRGIDAKSPGLINRRRDWNTPAGEKFALPTEIWRETIARRQRYFELRKKMENGEICEIDDLITYNLDIERFAYDALGRYEGSDFIAAFYEAIAGRKALNSKDREVPGITVLDPACGSGAFLFAALNVLEPLYRRCMERMRDFVDEDDLLRERGERKGTRKHPQFRAVLKDVEAHRNEQYWIYKTIILNNLYGVDIMREAAEIAKLRLFLKLAAEAEYDPKKNNLGLEPLPDIDYNIRSGNSLVGFASMEQFENAVSFDPKTGQRRMDYSDLTDEIREKAAEVRSANKAFRQAQDGGSRGYQEAKRELGERLGGLNDRMNRYLAEQYGVKEGNEYEKWLWSHRPFHWLTEFYGIIERGGFDVVIGNPPYVEYGKVKKNYTIQNYKTESCGNLYAMFIEKSFHLSNQTVGMIVQLPLVCTDRMSHARSLFLEEPRRNWFANFDDRPGKLFADLQNIRTTVFVSTLKGDKESFLKATQYQRWFSKNRTVLFQGIIYGDIKGVLHEGFFPKIGENVGWTVFQKLNQKTKCSYGIQASEHACYFHNAPRYWIRATDFVPYFYNDRDGEKQSSHVKTIYANNGLPISTVCALLNSTLFYWWFVVCSDCRDLNMREIENFPFDPSGFDKKRSLMLHRIVKELMKDYKRHVVRKKTNYQTTGNVVYDEFYPRHSKKIIDRIDNVLAEHYGFTDEELDYIINYDIKYRAGEKL